MNTTQDCNVKCILSQVYKDLSEGGYDPMRQITGYLITGDPTYITDYNGARTRICRVEREQLLAELVRGYLDL